MTRTISFHATSTASEQACSSSSRSLRPENGASPPFATQESPGTPPAARRTGERSGAIGAHRRAPRGLRAGARLGRVASDILQRHRWKTVLLDLVPSELERRPRPTTDCQRRILVEINQGLHFKDVGTMHCPAPFACRACAGIRGGGDRHVRNRHAVMNELSCTLATRREVENGDSDRSSRRCTMTPSCLAACDKPRNVSMPRLVYAPR